MATDMFLRESGHGPVVLFLHGTPSPAAIFSPLADRLAARYRVLVADLPGYGSSPAPVDASMGAVTTQLAEALTRRGIAELHGVVGYSSGGYRALHLALRSGIAVHTLVLLGGLADLPAANRDGFRALAELCAADPAQAVAVLRDAIPATSLSAAWCADHPDDVEALRRWASLASPAALAAEFRAIAAVEDLLPELSSLRSRLYLRVGELDAACPADWSRAIAAAAPAARLDLVPQCGHALLVEDADATARAVADALAWR